MKTEVYDSSRTMTGAEHLTGHFGDLTTADAAAQRLQEIGVSPTVIMVASEGANLPAPRAHIGESVLLGVAIGGSLGALGGAILAQSAWQLALLGAVLTGWMAGAAGGLGFGILMGVALGVGVGLLSRNTADSPLRGYDELGMGGVRLDADVPAPLAERARLILNAA